ncbi:hypothetical protein AVEN_72396-1, partial [Araneus ventricosus]
MQDQVGLEPPPPEADKDPTSGVVA